MPSRTCGKVALVMLLLSGCSDSRGNNSSARTPLSMFTVDSGVKLVITLPRDTIASDDQSPIDVNYYVVTGPTELIFDNNPGLYDLHVLTADGRLVKPTIERYTASMMIGETKLSLPARAMLGQALNLRCVQDEAGYGGGDPAGASDSCLGGYPLHERGSYRIIINYRGPDLRWRRPTSAAESSRAVFGKRAILEVIPDARHLADTATIVVK